MNLNQIFLLIKPALVPIAQAVAAPSFLIDAVDFIDEPEDVGFFDTTQENEGNNTYRNDNGYQHGQEVDIVSDGSVGYIRATEWLKYDIPFTVAQTYLVELRVSSGSGSTKTIQIEFEGETLTLSMPEETGWSSFIWKAAGTVTVAAGTQRVRVLFVSGNHNLSQIRLTPTT